MKNRKNKLDVREKALAHGMNFLFDEELVMLILGSGTKEMPVDHMSVRMLEVLDTSDKQKAVQNLMKLKGVGEGKALALAAAIELGRRKNNHLKAPIKSPRDIVPFVRSYAVSQKENFLVVTLNGGHEIIDIHCVSIGTVNKALIHPREVFSQAIKENAAAIIVCHNHPSGNCQPSKDDINTTEMLIDASVIMGIELLDHVIITYENYFSFVENNLLFTDIE